MFHSTYVLHNTYAVHLHSTEHQNIDTVGVPQIFINAQRYIASDSLAYTEICDPTPKNFMTKINEKQF